MRKVIPGIIVALTLIFTAIVYPSLPERIATHWGFNGEADGWSSRELGSWLMPLIMFAVWVLLRFLPRIDPLRENYQRFASTYSTIITIILAFMGILHVAVLGIALGWPVSMTRVIPLLIGGLLVVIGNLLPRARRNWFFGIRTPWTLSSERVWERTHRLGGWLFVAGGLILVAAAFGPPSVLFPVLMAVVIIASGVPLVYSLLLFLREKKASSGT